jgi:hypothetical protein
MQIDVKDGPESLILKVGKLIKFHNRERVTMWGSFRRDMNQICKESFPEIPRFFSRTHAVYSWFMWSIGLWSWYPQPTEKYLILPNLWFFMRSGWFHALNERNVKVIVFGIPGGGVNTIEGFQSIREAGGNGICTDRPSLLQQWLKTHPLKK